MATREGKNLQLPQLAVDSVIAYIQQSPERDVAALLYRAAQYANQILHRETGDLQPGACSLVVAAVLNGETLYLANIGNIALDSRQITKAGSWYKILRMKKN